MQGAIPILKVGAPVPQGCNVPCRSAVRCICLRKLPGQPCSLCAIMQSGNASSLIRAVTASTTRCVEPSTTCHASACSQYPGANC